RWAADKLSHQLDRLATTDGARWCYGAFATIDRRGATVSQPSGRPWRAFNGWIVDRIITSDAAVALQTLIAPTAMLRALRFDERLPLGGDYDLALRLAATAAGCAVDEVLAEIRLHDDRT